MMQWHEHFQPQSLTIHALSFSPLWPSLSTSYGSHYSCFIPSSVTSDRYLTSQTKMLANNKTTGRGMQHICILQPKQDATEMVNKLR
jgi:hypothetical protein